MSNGPFRLVHAEARRRAIEAVRNAPDGMIVKIAEPTRTLDQNAKLHAMIGDISKQKEHFGRLRSIESWKRLLTAAFLRARGESIELLPALDGDGVDVVFRQTSQMSVREIAEMIDFVGAWGDENDVEWSE